MFWKLPGPDKTPRCSFCQKWEHVAGQFIASPSHDEVFICEECVTVCTSILTDRRAAPDDTRRTAGPPATAN